MNMGPDLNSTLWGCSLIQNYMPWTYFECVAREKKLMYLKPKLTGDLHLIPGVSSLQYVEIMYVIHIRFAQAAPPFLFECHVPLIWNSASMCTPQLYFIPHCSSIWVFHSLFGSTNLMFLFRLFFPLGRGLCLSYDLFGPNTWKVFSGISMQTLMWLSTSLSCLGHYQVTLTSMAACQGLSCSMVAMQPAYTSSYGWYPSPKWSLSRYLIA